METYVKSKKDNLKLSVAYFEPTKKPVGVVQILHGMEEHKERYYDFIKYLNKFGYVTVIHDHRGHGKSVKQKEDNGYFYEESGTFIVEDAHQITELIKEKYKDLPIYLFAHSMGTFVGRIYIQKYDKDIKKLILSGAPSNNNASTMGLLLTKTIKLFKGDRYRSKLLEYLSIGSYQRAIQKKGLKGSWVSTKSKTIIDYDKDQLCGKNFTTNGYINLMHLILNTYNKKLYKVQNKNLPIKFFNGGDDPVLLNEKLQKQRIDFLKEIGYKNVSEKVYSGLRHEILNEVDNQIVYKDILDYIKK